MCLWYVISLEHSDMARYFLANKLYPSINVKTKNIMAKTPLALAIDFQDNAFSLIALLCDVEGKNLEITNEILQSCCSNRDIRILQLLLGIMVKNSDIRDWETFEKRQHEFNFDQLSNDEHLDCTVKNWLKAYL